MPSARKGCRARRSSKRTGRPEKKLRARSAKGVPCVRGASAAPLPSLDASLDAGMLEDWWGPCVSQCSLIMPRSGAIRMPRAPQQLAAATLCPSWRRAGSLRRAHPKPAAKAIKVMGWLVHLERASVCRRLGTGDLPSEQPNGRRARSRASACAPQIPGHTQDLAASRVPARRPGAVLAYWGA